ncbi:hypothetical protein B4589_015455 (plasmid) [Halolamina sp. CBA1230]|uniref:hypothetical protein n=1 Tax=Halolamina sp. CBA1230 TaxID=1853690 RepID=UPI00117A987A|nr:hypothetical protein [Halolamina sp. CBA1230]QKY21820.1 hypothetical protein B4589_015455 [Halolamina sp. CBA1230]
MENTTDEQVFAAGYAFVAMSLILGAILLYDAMAGNQTSGRVVIPFSIGQIIFWGYEYINI